jgi:hypothetical protein
MNRNHQPDGGSDAASAPAGSIADADSTGGVRPAALVRAACRTARADGRHLTRHPRGPEASDALARCRNAPPPFVETVEGGRRGHPRRRRMSRMQYLVSVIDHTPSSATGDEMAAIDTFNDSLRADGHWVFAGGLGAPGTATVVDGRGAETMFTDGPFVETKEWLSGFWVIEAPDLDAALKLAAAGSRACNRRVEVRPFL